jgi:molecular chaperone GrpE
MDSHPLSGEHGMSEQRKRHEAQDRESDGLESERNDAAATDDIAQLREQLDQERARADANFGNWQRATADFMNYKRRAEQEREENARFANTALVLNVLPAVDDLERALQHVDPELENTPWIDGVRQILRKLKGALTAAGVTEIEAEGATFDPNLHEAIAEGEGEAGVVVSEAQRGYRIGNRVIRPSMVVVGRGNGRHADGEGGA